MDEALRMLGSFARFVEDRAPMLATELRPLAMQWATRENIPLAKLMAALKPPPQPDEVSPR
jgi:hypothetical protein